MDVSGAVMGPRTYDIFFFKDGVRGQWVGGAPDVASASSLAAGWLTTAQKLYPTSGGGVGVVDVATDLVVAYVGWETPEV